MKVLLIVIVPLTIFSSVFSEGLNDDDSSKDVKDTAPFDLGISFGVSFNFVEKIIPNSLYGDLTFEWIDIWRSDTKIDFLNDLIRGFDVGMNNGRIVSRDSIKDESATTDIFSASMSLNRQIFRKSESLFYIFHTEARKKHIIFHSGSLPDIDQQFWDSFFGGGFMFYNKNVGDNKIKLKLIVGGEFEYYEGDRWQCMGISQFSFVNRQHGIKIGIEIRGRLGRYEEKYANYNPEMLVYLSKVFGIQKLLKFLGNSI